MSAILRTIGLRKSYNDAGALYGINLEVEEGSVYGLIGPNGAGKTTTIRILMNILQASGGRAEVFDIDSTQLSPEDFARIGYVSENQEMPVWMTVEYLLRYLKPFYPSWDLARMNKLLHQFKLPRDRKLSELSRGMWMKTALLSSLAYHPRVLVLDEPFSGLDPVVREDLIAGLVDGACETSIFVSSHDLADIESFATHIGYREKGRLCFSEEMASLSARFREIEVFVDSPSILDNSQWPRTWLLPQTRSGVVRFVETRFDPERTTNHIRDLFSSVQRVSVNPMPLRSIFLTLARSE